MRKSILFIDGGVLDSASVTDYLRPDFDVVMLDSAVDGLDQMAGALARRSHMQAIHILSHGAPGMLTLGAAEVRSCHLAAYAEQLRIIGASLTADGEILLYGCELAQGDLGRAWVEQFAQLSGAKVAASAYRMGAEAGVWHVEDLHGLPVHAALLPMYGGTLAYITKYGSDQQVVGSDEDDYISFTGSNNTLLGGNGNDTLTTMTSISVGNTLLGEGGNDSLMGGYGNDRLDGGDGDDYILAWGSSGLDTMLGGAGNDTLRVGVTGRYKGTIVASGGDGDDSFELDMSIGSADTQLDLSGGQGADTYRIGGEVVLDVTILDFAAGLGGDRIDLSSLLVLSNDDNGYKGGNPFSANLHYLRLVQSGGDTLLQYDMDGVTGGEFDFRTVLTLNNVDASTLTAANFVDGIPTSVISPDGGDVAGRIVIGTGGDETLVGGHFDDNISGGSGNDRLSGNTGDDTLDGGDGDDFLSGDAGDDSLMGGDGDDTFWGMLDDGNDTLVGGAGNDYFQIWWGGSGRHLAGNAAIVIDGGAGDDVIYVYLSGTGRVTATGGAGRDTYEARDPDGVALLYVQDFVAGNGGDRIDLATLLDVSESLPPRTGKPGYVGGNPFTAAAGVIRLVQDGTTTLVQYDMDGAVGSEHNFVTFAVLLNVKASDLKAANFVGDISPDGSPVTGSVINVPKDAAWHQSIDGSYFNDTLIGGKVPVYLYGFGGDDVLRAGAKTGSEFDTLSGGVGDDRYVVLSPGDIVYEAESFGYDTVDIAFTAAGTYVLPDNVENATITAAATIAANITGNALDNILTGNAAANTLIGGAGNDTLIGGAGADKLSGGVGDDTYVVADAGDVITELLGEGTDTVQTTLASYTLGANVDNLIYTGIAAFTGTGNVLGNVITGGNAGNKLDGGAGNDTLSGGGGNDSLQGGLGDDAITAGTGKDTIDGGAGIDVLQGLGNFTSYTITRPNATDTVLTSAGGNVLTVRNVENFIFADGPRRLDQVQDNIASIGNDNLHGTDGDDVLNGGLGVDTLDGGLGDDTYVILDAADVVLEDVRGGTDLVQVALTAAGTYTLAVNVENATVTAAAGIAANITGNALDNILTGNAAANTLIGGAGNDTLIGGAGADKLSGGVGDDIYVVADAGDVVTELLGEGTDTVQTTLSTYTLAANVENLAYTGIAAFTGTGNVLGNVIIGGNAGNKLDGGAGNDTLFGGGGNDSLQGGLGDDVIVAGAGKDTVDGGVGADVLQGLGNFASYTITRPNATDTVLTSAGGNMLTVRNVENFIFADGLRRLDQVQDNIASIGNDDLHGTNGDDVLNGGLGVDTLDGGLGNDTYVILNAADVVIEGIGGGTDLVQVALTAAGTYTLAANVENATVTAAASVAANVTGNALDNILTGNAAANNLIGGAGNDTLIGGAGADKLSGGIGDDTYVVADAGDVVTELLGEGIDTVQTTLATFTLAANVDNLTYAGIAAFTGTGNVLGNVITGGNGGNKLDGGAGNDTLSGGNGSDSLQGGLGDDAITAGAGKDTIDGGAGADLLQGLGNFASYTITRPNATDTVLTSAGGNVLTVRNVERFGFADGEKMLAQVQDNIASIGNDNLHGTIGDDVLNGGLGIDTLDGGLGNDTYVILNAADVVKEDVGGGTDLVQVALTAAGTYTLAANVENATVTAAASIAANITGNALDNILTGNAAANTLIGGAGNDTLIGGAGADKLSGGVGDDTYVVADASDVITELLGEGTDTVQTTLASYTLGANVDNLIYTGIAAFTGTGNGLGNVITGGNAGNKLDGGAGNDTLSGGVGNDSLQGGLGDDELWGGGGKDTIDGGLGDDRVWLLSVARGDVTVSRISATDTLLTDLAGNKLTLRGVESVAFSDGDARIDELLYNRASPFGDHLYGGAENDTLNGGLGIDTLQGGTGDDTYVIADKASLVLEGEDEGIDTVQVALTAAGTYTLADNVENASVTAAASVAVSLTGNALDNLLVGNAATNTLSGGAGADTLDGGAGADKLIGGTGDDLYIVTESGDVVTELAGEGVDTVLTTLASYTMAANVELLWYVGSGIFTGIGNAQPNLMTAGDGGSRMDGGGDDDFLIGGAGNDSLSGGVGDDLFGASSGRDTIDGGQGDDTVLGLDDYNNYRIVRLNATDSVLTHYSGATLTVRGVEWIDFGGIRLSMAEALWNTVGPGSDTVVGGDYDDLLDGGLGNDVLIGGNGDDYYILSAPGDTIIELAGGGDDTAQLAFTAAASYTLAAEVESAVITGTAAVSVVGNALDNYLGGNAAANNLSGGLGDDTLVGGAGNDTMAGGAGDDVYVVADAGDLVKENLGEGYDMVFTKLASYTLSANVEDLVYDGIGAFIGIGNATGNRLFAVASSGARLDGGGGDDRLIGGAGDDSLSGGLGNDLFQASGGRDTIDGGAGVDAMYALNAFGSYRVTRSERRRYRADRRRRPGLHGAQR